MVGDFLVMAATPHTYQIKDASPPVDEEAPGEEEGPELELIQRLLEYQTFKDASLGLREKRKRNG